MSRGVSMSSGRFDPDALVTATEASASPHLCGVSRQLIGMWRHLGKLQVRGTRGRSPLYRYGDILKVEIATRMADPASQRAGKLAERISAQLAA